MSYYTNKNWHRVYEITFNDVDTLFHRVNHRASDDFIVDTIELEEDNTLIITEEQISDIQRFGNGIKTMTYVGKLLDCKPIADKEKEEEK